MSRDANSMGIGEGLKALARWRAGHAVEEGEENGKERPARAQG